MDGTATDRGAGEQILRFDDGGLGRLVFGFGVAIIACVFAYGPLAVSLLFPDFIQDNSIGLWVFWAICMSWAVKVAAETQIRELIEIDPVRQRVCVISTTCFLVSRTRLIPFADIAAVEALTYAADPSDEVQPLPRPVLRLQSGAIVGIAAQNYSSSIPSVDAAREKRAEDLVTAVRALVLPSLEARAA